MSSPMGEKEERVYILLFVDDKLLSGCRNLLDMFKSKIMKRWKCKDLVAVETFVGFQVRRDRLNCSLSINQELYLRKLLE